MSNLMSMLTLGEARRLLKLWTILRNVVENTGYRNQELDACLDIRDKLYDFVLNGETRIMFFPDGTEERTINEYQIGDIIVNYTLEPAPIELVCYRVVEWDGASERYYFEKVKRRH